MRDARARWCGCADVGIGRNGPVIITNDSYVSVFVSSTLYGGVFCFDVVIIAASTFQ